MNENSLPKKQTSHIQFGVLYGVLMILGFVLVYLLKIDSNEKPMIGRFLSVCSYFIFPVVLLFFGIKIAKKNNSGTISVTECLKIGVSIAFIGAFLFGLFNVIFNLVFPEYLDKILIQTRKIMLEQDPNMKELQIQNGLSMTRKFSSPFLSFPFTILLFSFLGLVYSLIIGLIVRTEKSQYN